MDLRTGLGIAGFARAILCLKLQISSTNLQIPIFNDQNLPCIEDKMVLWKNRKGEKMDKYVCTLCGYVYDPEEGDPDNSVAPGTQWKDVPDDWECPVCGASKDDFEKEE